MADEIDTASDLEQLHRDLALKRHAEQSGAGKPSRTHCMDCGAEIDERRRKLGGVVRCTECATLREIRQKHHGRRTISGHF